LLRYWRIADIGEGRIAVKLVSVDAVSGIH
jgi:hypothetical protein